MKKSVWVFVFTGAVLLLSQLNLTVAASEPTRMTLSTSMKATVVDVVAEQKYQVAPEELEKDMFWVTKEECFAAWDSGKFRSYKPDPKNLKDKPPYLAKGLGRAGCAKENVRESKVGPQMFVILATDVPVVFNQMTSKPMIDGRCWNGIIEFYELPLPKGPKGDKGDSIKGNPGLRGLRGIPGPPGLDGCNAGTHREYSSRDGSVGPCVADRVEEKKLKKGGFPWGKTLLGIVGGVTAYEIWYNWYCITNR